MANIFGKSEHEYTHLTKLRSANMLDSHNAALKQRGKEHNFAALRDMHNPLAMPFNDVEANAQAIGFLTNNLQAIQSEIEEIFYSDFRLNRLMPIVTNIPEGATTYAYRVVDKAGQGRFISNDGTNAGNASVSSRLVAYNLSYGGIVPEWTMEDLRNATFSGIPLDRMTIEAAVEGAMDHIEQVGISGDAQMGFTGLINNADVPTATAAAEYSTLDGDAVVADIQSRIRTIVENTHEIVGRMIKTDLTIYASYDIYDLITNTAYSDNRDQTIWEYVKKNNIFTRLSGNELMIELVEELATAGAGDTDRMMIGFNNAKVMEFAMPFAPRVITTIEKGFTVQAPMEYKISGLNVKRPGTMIYVDGV